MLELMFSEQTIGFAMTGWFCYTTLWLIWRIIKNDF